MNKTTTLRAFALILGIFILRFAISCCNPNSGTDYTEKYSDVTLKILDASGLGEPTVVTDRVERDNLAFQIDYIYELVQRNQPSLLNEFGFATTNAQCDNYDNYFLQSQVEEIKVYYIANGQEVDVTNDMRVLAYNSFYTFPEYLLWIIYDDNDKLEITQFQSVRANRYPANLQFKVDLILKDDQVVSYTTNEIQLI